jgi:hypothetical protein
MTSIRQPYEYQGQIYLGMNAVCEAAGVTKGAVCYHLRRYGSLARLGEVKRTLSPLKSKPQAVAGRAFPSLTAVADAAGTSRTRVARWLAAGREADVAALIFAHHDNLEAAQ